jgi:hypothetical protein
VGHGWRSRWAARAWGHDEGTSSGVPVRLKPPRPACWRSPARVPLMEAPGRLCAGAASGLSGSGRGAVPRDRDLGPQSESAARDSEPESEPGSESAGVSARGKTEAHHSDARTLTSMGVHWQCGQPAGSLRLRLSGPDWPRRGSSESRRRPPTRRPTEADWTSAHAHARPLASGPSRQCARRWTRPGPCH